MAEPMLVKARLGGQLAGEPPRLDALLEWCVSLHYHGAVSGYKVDRKLPAPPQGVIPIPVLRRPLGEWSKACVSDPILSAADVDTVEHIAKRIGVEKANLLATSARRVVETRNSWTKSYRLPMRTRKAETVAWFVLSGSRRELLKTLRRHVAFVGKKVSVGYGRVAEWTVERVDEDFTWFAPTEHGPLLMATLPVGDWLPDNLIGARRDFGSCVAPYFHPERYTDIVCPC